MPFRHTESHHCRTPLCALFCYDSPAFSSKTSPLHNKSALLWLQDQVALGIVRLLNAVLLDARGGAIAEVVDANAVDFFVHDIQ